MRLHVQNEIACAVQVSKVAKIRNRYNQVPHLTQDTNGKVTNSQKTPQTRAKRSALSQQVTTKQVSFRQCSFDDVFSLFEVDQVNVKYVSRASQSRFFVNYVTNTNQIDKNRMQYRGLDNDKAKHVSNLVLCENKSNLHQQNPQWWCFLCPLPPFCFAQKIHCIWSGSYSVYLQHIICRILL